MKNSYLPFLIAGGFITNIHAQQQSPNIIYILADDLGYGDIGCYGQKIIQTPNIDKLASNGMLFTQHYSGSTVSAPSRSCLLTGLHTGHTPIRGNLEVKPEGQQPLPAGTFTLAHMLKNQGYSTAAFGKWGLGFPESEGNPNAMGFDLFYGYNCQRVAHYYYPTHIYRNNQKILIPENEDGKRGVYAQDLIQNEMLRFIRENAREKFFVYMPVLLPHAELASPQDSIYQLYNGKIDEIKPYVGSKRGYGSSETPHADFAAMVTRLDAYVGQVMTELKSLGIEKNTIVIFTSDNGPHREGGADPDFFNSNGNLRGSKRDLYEGGIRVPMIVSWPGVIAPNSKTDHISAFWDVMPTVNDILKAKTNFNTDGISFYKTLINKNGQKQHEFLYWEFHEGGGKIAIRTGKWKGIKLDYAKNKDSQIQLYDLSNDIGETNNVANVNSKVVRKIDKLMKNARVDSELFNFK